MNLKSPKNLTKRLFVRCFRFSLVLYFKNYFLSGLSRVKPEKATQKGILQIRDIVFCLHFYGVIIYGDVDEINEWRVIFWMIY